MATFEIRVDGQAVTDNAYREAYNGTKRRIALYIDGEEYSGGNLIWFVNGQAISAVSLEFGNVCNYKSIWVAGFDVTPISFELYTATPDGFHIRVDSGDGKGFVYLGNKITLYGKKAYTFAVYNGDSELDYTQYAIESWSGLGVRINHDHMLDRFRVDNLAVKNTYSVLKPNLIDPETEDDIATKDLKLTFNVAEAPLTIHFV